MHQCPLIYVSTNPSAPSQTFISFNNNNNNGIIDEPANDMIVSHWALHDNYIITVSGVQSN